MTPRLLLLAIPMIGLGFSTGCDHHDHDHDHRRAGRDTDVIVVPARGQQYDRGDRFDQIDRNNDGDIGRGEWRRRDHN